MRSVRAFTARNRDLFSERHLGDDADAVAGRSTLLRQIRVRSAVKVDVAPLVTTRFDSSVVCPVEELRILIR